MNRKNLLRYLPCVLVIKLCIFNSIIGLLPEKNQEILIYKNISVNKMLPLQEIEDVEILSFFVLFNYYSRFKPKKMLDDSKHLKEALTFNESSLHNFLDDMKNGLLDQRAEKKAKRIDCKKTDSGFYRHLLKRYRSGNDHLRKIQRLCEVATQCHSTEDLLALIKSENIDENGEDLKFSQSIVRLCPLILFQLQDQTCTAKREKDLNLYVPKPSPGNVWGFAILFVTIISFCSLIGVAIMPFTNKNSYHFVLNLFEGLAVGSLIGSSIFHLIPQAFNLFGSNNDYLWKALIIFGGIYLFFWSEIIMKMMAEFRRRKKNNKNTRDKNTIKSQTEEMRKIYFSSKANEDYNQTDIINNQFTTSSLIENKSFFNKEEDAHCEQLNENKSNFVECNNTIISNFTNKSDDKIYVHSHNRTHVCNDTQQIATVAWMIIFGDGLHNFIDGLSIGAAFSESIMSGISVSVAVVCEEFPHELGDFAVLISSGMTMRQAIGYNFLSACTCYIGMILGILIGDLTFASSYILALAGGMFLYISLVDMMAELTTAIDEALHQSKKMMFKVLFLQNAGILIGISSLFLLAKYSENIKFEGFAPPMYPVITV